MNSMKNLKTFLVLIVIHVFLFTTSVAQEKKQFNALLVTKTAGWHHESINEGVTAIK